MENKKVEIGRRIREIRLHLHLDQESFGQKIGGKSKSAVSKYENGDTYPSLDTLELISVIAEKPLEWIIHGKDVTGSYQGTNSHLSGQEDLLCKMKDFPEAAAMMKMFLEIPESERPDALEIVDLYRNLPRSQRMRRKADILEDIEKIEEKKKGASEEAP